MTKSTLTDVFTDFVSLFYPRYCAGCASSLVKGEEYICTRCISDIPRTNFHLEVENAFFQKLFIRIPVRYVMAFFKFSKAGKVQKVLHTLKYKNQPELGQMLGRIYGNELLAAGYGGKFDVIVPVPLHKFKKARRGFNQSEEFGKGLAESLNIQCEGDFMQRLYKTQTQTRKSRLGRWQNVKEVFAVSKGRDANQRILLVDDVVTTGATLEAAGKVLIDSGCNELSVASIAATH